MQIIVDPTGVATEWSTGYVAFGAMSPEEMPQSTYGTEVYQLNEQLLQKAFSLTEGIELMDNETAAAYRMQYSGEKAQAAPFVSICDTVSADTWFHGTELAEAAESRAAMLTDGKANYCTTQQEDNATLTALKRGEMAGLLDFERVAIARGASNFDREPESMSAIESLRAQSGGYMPSVTNVHRVSAALAQAIISDWEAWESGVPQ